MKKADPKTRIDKLEKCIRSKDKRIKKIEDYFKLRNRLILSVLWSLLIALPWLLLVLYTERTYIAVDTLPITIIIFSLIGIVVSVVGTFLIWIFGMEKIWPN